MGWRREIIFILLVLLSIPAMRAAKEKELPIDPELRIGRLENGLTYYIRHNEQPKGRAEFWLVQNTGSLVEEDDEKVFVDYRCGACNCDNTRCEGEGVAG